jgi:hypothetical protein
MRRLLVLATLAGVAAMPVAALAAGTGKTHHYTDHLVGALVQSQGKTTVYAYKVQSNDSGPGASVSVNTITSSTGGKTRSVNFFASGSVRAVGTYHVGAAGSSGLAALTASGRITGGTGAFKGARGTFHATGTDNPKTNMVKLTLTGVITP